MFNSRYVYLVFGGIVLVLINNPFSITTQNFFSTIKCYIQSKKNMHSLGIHFCFRQTI